MRDREIALLGVFFAFLISFSVYGKIEEERNERKMVRELIEYEGQEGWRDLVPLAREYRRCLQTKKEYEKEGFEYEACNVRYDGIEERWQIEYETNIDGSFMLTYKYSDVDSVRVYGCEGRNGKLYCERIE